MKRGAEQQLTKDGRDEDEDYGEDPSTGFVQADPTELAKRPMKGLPKRRGGPPSPAKPAAQETEAQPKPVFGGFSGFGGFGATPSTAATTTPDTSPSKAPLFGSFGGFGNPSSSSTTSSFGSSSNPFSQPAAAPPLPSQPSKTSQLFGNSLASASASLAAAQNPFSTTTSTTFGPPTASTATSTFPTASSFSKTGNSTSAGATTSSDAATSSKDPEVEYFVSLRGLNHSVLTALERAIAEDPFVELPLDQISKSYNQYWRDIQKEKDKKASSTTSTAVVPATTAQATPPAPAPVFSMPKPPSGGFFSSSQPSAPPPSTANAKTVSFGSTQPSITDNKTGFSFGGGSSGGFSSSSPFSMPATKKDDPPKPPAVPNFGSFVGFGQPSTVPVAAKKADEETKEQKPKETMDPAPPPKTLYPFNALTPAPSLSTPATNTNTNTNSRPPVPSFFSFGSGSTPAATPAQTPPTPVPAEKRPALSSFGFGSSPGKSWSFGTPTPAGGSLGNPVGFSFGSPPKDPPTPSVAAPGMVPPSAGTTAALEAAAAISSSHAVPASSVASIIDGSVGGNTREPSVALQPSEDGGGASKADGDDETVGEGEEDEETVVRARAKLHKYKDGWHDMGTGQFKLKVHKVTGAKRVLMRNDGAGKVILNFRIHSDMNPTMPAKPTTIKFNGHEDGEPVPFQVRFKNAEEAQTMLKHMNELLNAV